MNRQEALAAASSAIAPGSLLGGLPDDGSAVADLVVNAPGRMGAAGMSGECFVRAIKGDPAVVYVQVPYLVEIGSEVDERSGILVVRGWGTVGESATWMRGQTPSRPPAASAPVADALRAFLNGRVGATLPAGAGGGTLRAVRIEAVIEPERVFEVAAYAEPASGAFERRALMFRLTGGDGTSASDWDFRLLTQP